MAQEEGGCGFEEEVRGKGTLSVATPLFDDSLVQSFQIPAPWLSFH